MWEKALEIASHITHPGTVAVFAALLAAYLFSIAIKKRQSRITWLLAAVVLILGLAPLLSSTYLQSRGLYIVRVFVLGVDKQPVDEARVTSSNGGEAKKIQGGWEFDIPPQSRPADGKLKLFASEKNAFLAGTSTLVLDKDYFPAVEIKLVRDTSAVVRGAVIDDHGRSVAGARVSIPGYPDVAVTDEMGTFVLPAHAADGQMVQVRAQKSQLVGTMSVPGRYVGRVGGEASVTWGPSCPCATRAVPLLAGRSASRIRRQAGRCKARSDPDCCAPCVGSSVNSIFKCD
jgi:hypothetical protein